MEASTQDMFDQMNKAAAVHGKPRTALEDCLQSLRKDELYILAANLRIAGRSGMNKQELVSSLNLTLLNQDKVLEILLLTCQEEWDLFKQLLEQPVLESRELYPNQYGYLKEHGIIYAYWHEDRQYYVIPGEIQALIRGMDLKPFRQMWKRHRQVVDYISAAVNLYGACECLKLLDIYNSQNAEKITLGEMESIAGKHLARPQYFFRDEDYWVSNYFEDEAWEELPELLEQSRYKPYYIPDKTEFLRYAESSYSQNTLQLEKLKAYILKHITREPLAVEIIMENIQLGSSMEEPLDGLLAEFEYQNIHLTFAQMDALIPLLVEVRNNTRLWANRGYTPVEMRLLHSKGTAPLASRGMGTVMKANFTPREESAPKVGRNDPCPCGSGKKHKKCCGAVEKE